MSWSNVRFPCGDPMAPLEQELKQQALALGFTHVGIARAEVLHAERQRLAAWLGRGLHAGMKWMERDPDKRTDPGMVLEGACSVVVAAMNYYTPHGHEASPDVGKISRYAWGEDYHTIVVKRLDLLRQWLHERVPESKSLTYADTGPILEKAWAQRAGVGWIGKNGNVITRDRGSWVFLGVMLTTARLQPDRPETDHCGSCTRCIDACPTDAIVESGVIDSNRCISYLTIEHRAAISGPVADQFEGWIYGCDICQDVCPWNVKFARPTTEPGFQPRAGQVAPSLASWAEMTAGEFAERFAGSPIRRTKHAGLIRNIEIVLRTLTRREGKNHHIVHHPASGDRQ
jgi:epoxyqueuosine reductase